MASRKRLLTLFEVSVRVKGTTLRRPPQKGQILPPQQYNIRGKIPLPLAEEVVLISRCTGAACWGLRFFLVMVCVSTI
jgi:hypothetical protein